MLWAGVLIRPMNRESSILGLLLMNFLWTIGRFYIVRQSGLLHPVTSHSVAPVEHIVAVFRVEA